MLQGNDHKTRNSQFDERASTGDTGQEASPPQAGQGSAHRVVPYSFFETMVDTYGGVYPGTMQLAAFKAMNPVDRYYTDYVELLSKINDQSYLEKNRVFRTWYEYTQDLAGAWFLEAVRHIFYENRINLFAQFKSIRCPVMMIGGTKDDITLPEQVFGFEHFISTPKIDRYKFLVESGHIGLFMSRKALTEVWPKVVKAVADPWEEFIERLHI